MRVYRSVLEPKYFTCKEWKKFDKLTNDYIIIDNEKYYLTMQEILLAKYQIILTDYKTRNEKIIHVLKKFNGKNLDKGIKVFNTGVSSFTDSIDSFTKELGNNTKSARKNKVKIWNKPQNKVKIWSEKKTKRKYRKRKPVQRSNIDILMGKKR